MKRTTISIALVALASLASAAAAGCESEGPDGAAGPPGAPGVGGPRGPRAAAEGGVAVEAGGGDDSGDEKKEVEEATEEPPEGMQELWPVLGRQAKLLAAADDLAELLKAVPPYDEVPEGFGAIELDLPAEAVQLFWKAESEIPGEVRSKIESLGEHHGVSIEIAKSPLSMREINEARNVLREAMRSGDRPWRSISTRPHAAGVTIGVAEGAEASEAESPLVMEVSYYLGAVASWSDTFVVVEPSAGYRFLSREADFSPFFGGARIGAVGAPSAHCSVGFAAGNVFGRSMLTAEHCNLQNGVPIANGDQSRVMGCSAGHALPNQDYDVARVAINAPATNAGRMYDGAVGQAPVSRRVAGQGGSFVGMLVCTSGAFSGAVCNIQVTAVNTMAQDIFTLNIIDGLVIAEQLDHGNAAGSGDSGGPVFTIRGDLTTIAARGIISAGGVGPQWEVGCTGETSSPSGGNRFCSAQVAYAEIANALRYNDMWLELSP